MAMELRPEGGTFHVGPSPPGGLGPKGLLGRSEGFPLAAYSIPGREGRGLARIQNCSLVGVRKSRDLFFPENKGPCQEKPLLAHDLKKGPSFPENKGPCQEKTLLAHDFKKGPSFSRKQRPLPGKTTAST